MAYCLVTSPFNNQPAQTTYRSKGHLIVDYQGEVGKGHGSPRETVQVDPLENEAPTFNSITIQHRQ